MDAVSIFIGTMLFPMADPLAVFNSNDNNNSNNKQQDWMVDGDNFITLISFNLALMERGSIPLWSFSMENRGRERVRVSKPRDCFGEHGFGEHG